MLKDNFNRIHNSLRISLTDRCNFGCIYCIPSSALAWNGRDSILSFEEIERLVMLFAELGITQLRLTGGEPLVRKNIEILVEKLSHISGIEKIGLTTNGYSLREKAKVLKGAGITHVNISLDSLIPEKFKFIAKHDGLENVLNTIEECLSLGFQRVKINTVIMKGINDNEPLDFIDYFKDKDLDLRFIEFMPYGNNGWSRDKYISFTEIRKIIESKYVLAQLTNGRRQVSANFRISGIKASIGFINSNSLPFCSGCSRLRLSSDGKLKLCLYSKQDYDLKKMLRNGACDKEIKSFIKDCIYYKEYRHAPLEELEKESDLAMIKVGG